MDVAVGDWRGCLFLWRLPERLEEVVAGDVEVALALELLGVPGGVVVAEEAPGLGSGDTS